MRLLALLLAIVPNTLIAEVMRFDCNFDLECSPDDGCKPSQLPLEFSLDDESGAANMVGNVGMVDVFPIFGSVAWTFLETLQGGYSQMTTITRTGAAIHSRHTLVLGKPVPSQWHGLCEMTTIGG